MWQRNLQPPNLLTFPLSQLPTCAVKGVSRPHCHLQYQLAPPMLALPVGPASAGQDRVEQGVKQGDVQGFKLRSLLKYATGQLDFNA